MDEKMACAFLFMLVCSAALPVISGYRMATAIGGGGGSSDESRAMAAAAAAAAAAVAAANEPTCDQLRVMWRFSKRQSRAAEITNELPTYRDPLAYNVWEAYARTRSGGGRRRPAMVFGRIVHDARTAASAAAPSTYEALLTASPDRLRAFEEVTRLYGDRAGPPAPSRKTSFRGASTQPRPVSSGQFQHLKELIRSERARELLEQRMKEEAVARAEALKDIVNQVHFGRIVQHQKGQLEQAMAYAEQSNGQQGHGHGYAHSQLIHKRTLPSPYHYPFIVDYYDDQADKDDDVDPSYFVTNQRRDASFRPRPHPQRLYPKLDIDVDTPLSKRTERESRGHGDVVQD
ncbi:hypothetical protein LSTR_LSTR007699 [Laodelphax striatellus]|uniref:Uncharacterized protein n=1 Tax=Laodelphax striatellus TaxID=195883 RepID=A0A482WIK9_LAOST|nr:hypothetical protein LSTR_LSTR007699 [Laodelphax striatellus]